ncbi:hypothetical protein ACS0TY_030680 [Phlomoides rotata]
MNFGLLIRARDCIPVNCTRNPSTKRGCRTKKLNSFGNGQVNDELYSLTQVVLGYTLETTAYILNLVLSKLVPKTPSELWTGRKPSLRHIRIWGCPSYVLDKEADKLDPRSELRLFVGYPRGTKKGLFYSPKDQRIMVSTHSRFLEDDYAIQDKDVIYWQTAMEA